MCGRYRCDHDDDVKEGPGPWDPQKHTEEATTSCYGAGTFEYDTSKGRPVSLILLFFFMFLNVNLDFLTLINNFCKV